MGLANKSVVLYESIKVGKKWHFRPVDENASRFSDGPFYVSWYDGKKKQMEPAGRDPEHALRMAHLRRSALAFVAAGGEITISNLVRKPTRADHATPAVSLEEIMHSDRVFSLIRRSDSWRPCPHCPGPDSLRPPVDPLR